MHAFLEGSTLCHFYLTGKFFSHPWETVASAAWRKYPNPHNTAVLGTDVVERRIVDGVLHTERLVSSKWYFPKWAQAVSQILKFHIISQNEKDKTSSSTCLVDIISTHIWHPATKEGLCPVGHAETESTGCVVTHVIHVTFEVNEPFYSINLCYHHFTFRLILDLSVLSLSSNIDNLQLVCRFNPIIKHSIGAIGLVFTDQPNWQLATSAKNNR